MPIRIEVPLPFPIRSVNAWWFPGADPALIDCGLGTDEARALLAAAVDDWELDVYLTHGHVDHAGNAAWLAAKGATVHAPQAEAPYIETFRRDSAARNDKFRDALLLHGMPPEVAVAVRARSDAIDAYAEDTPIRSALVDGQRIVLGDAQATVHVLPGHTPGSTVYATDQGDLVTGDTLLETITSNAIELLPEDEGRFHTYLRSLEALRRFVGRRVLPGHHAPFTLTDQVLDHHMEKHARRAQRIRSRLERPRSAWELLPDVFPRLRSDQHFLAMSDVVGHLHALEVDGLVERREHDGVRRFVGA